MAAVVSDADVLDLALDAFADQGYDGTSVREVCRRLGVSHNLIHERYGSKERLWYAAIEHGFRTWRNELATAAQEEPGDELDRLRPSWSATSRYGQRPAMIRIINHERPGLAAGSTTCTTSTSARPTRSPTWCSVTWPRRAGRRAVSPAVLHFLVGHGAGGIVSLPALAERFPGGDGSLTDQARRRLTWCCAASCSTSPP